jgi:hypothetical protein
MTAVDSDRAKPSHPENFFFDQAVPSVDYQDVKIQLLEYTRLDLIVRKVNDLDVMRLAKGSNVGVSGYRVFFTQFRRKCNYGSYIVASFYELAQSEIPVIAARNKKD